MRVLILGVDYKSGLMLSYERAFRTLGWGVETYCLQRAFDDALPGMRNRVARRLMYTAACRRLNAAVLGHLADVRADLVLVLKGEKLSAETVRALREQTGGMVVNYYPDDPFSDARSNRLAYGAAVLAAYDHCFTFARHLMPAYRDVGAHRVSYLPFALDPALHQPVPTPPPPEFDVVFVGNIDAERVRWLEPAADFRLAVFGELTSRAVPRGSALRRAAYFPAAYDAQFAQALARGAISLNVMRAQNRLSHNMRSYESPGCGAFTLSQRTPELAELFVEGEEIACISSPEDVRAQVARWLASPADRQRIAAAGLRKARRETYAKRAETILEVLDLAPMPARTAASGAAGSPSAAPRP